MQESCRTVLAGNTNYGTLFAADGTVKGFTQELFVDLASTAFEENSIVAGLSSVEVTLKDPTTWKGLGKQFAGSLILNQLVKNQVISSASEQTLRNMFDVAGAVRSVGLRSTGLIMAPAELYYATFADLMTTYNDASGGAYFTFYYYLMDKYADKSSRFFNDDGSLKAWKNMAVQSDTICNDSTAYLSTDSNVDHVARKLCQTENYKSLVFWLSTTDGQAEYATSLANLFLFIKNIHIRELKTKVTQQVALERESDNPTPPPHTQTVIANAGADQTITQDDNVTLNASASMDSDGTIVSYQWKDANTVLSNDVSFTISDLSVGTHIITLTVTDNDGEESTDTVIITVNTTDSNPPTINIINTSYSSPTIISAEISTDDDRNITRTSFAIYDSRKSKLDITSSVSVTSPVSTFNSDPTALTWGYNPDTLNTTTSWNIDISGLSRGNYYIKFFATDGVNHASETDYIGFTTDSNPPTISIINNSYLPPNVISANITTDDDQNITRTSFALYDSMKSKLDIRSSVSVTSPVSTFNSAPTALTWGYDPDTLSTTTSWNIDISGLSAGNYYIKFFATDGVNHAVETDYVGFTKHLGGDIDQDGDIDLTDAVLGLQIISGDTPTDSVFTSADINNDNRIGVEEIIHILREISSK